MSLRRITLLSLAITLLAVGSTLWASDLFNGEQSILRLAAAKDAAIHSRTAKGRKEEPAPTRLDALTVLLGDNKELFVYGAIAAFGILMMGLAIGSASSSAKSKTAEQLTRLKEEKEKAENLAKLKAEFLNQVSHELRSPLAVIIGYIECITDGLYGEVESKHHEILQVVAKQSTHLKNMIDQILIYSRLEAGKQPIRIEELQLTKVVNDMRDTFEFLCRQKGLELRWEIPKDPLPIRSDATRLKEVVSNLLQNAVKYTDRGSITVRTAKDSSADVATVDVQDTGMGISEQHLANIFEPFMQVHKTSTENSRGGIGLGLSIVKKHLEQIGGTITVESELGKGSTFRVVIPRNYDKQKSRKGWLKSLVKSKPTQPSMAVAALNPRPDTKEREVAGTRRAVG